MLTIMSADDDGGGGGAVYSSQVSFNHRSISLALLSWDIKNLLVSIAFCNEKAPVMKPFIC